MAIKYWAYLRDDFDIINSPFSGVFTYNTPYDVRNTGNCYDPNYGSPIYEVTSSGGSRHLFNESEEAFIIVPEGADWKAEMAAVCHGIPISVSQGKHGGSLKQANVQTRAYATAAAGSGSDDDDLDLNGKQIFIDPGCMDEAVYVTTDSEGRLHKCNPDGTPIAEEKIDLENGGLKPAADKDDLSDKTAKDAAKYRYNPETF